MCTPVSQDIADRVGWDARITGVVLTEEILRELDTTYAFCSHRQGHDMVVAEASLTDPKQPAVVRCERCGTELS